MLTSRRAQGIIMDSSDKNKVSRVSTYLGKEYVCVGQVDSKVLAAVG